MNTKALAIGWMGLSGLVGAASAQVVSSGILHTPLGNVTDMSSVERRLTACCLGSSGEDGVEVRASSLWGGGVGVDLTPMAVGGREIRIRPKGWDGTIKGSCRIVSNDDGTITYTVDFSAIGAVGCRVREFDGHGVLVSEIVTDTPTCNGPIVPNCPPPLVPTVWWTSYGQWVWGCGVGLNLHGDPYPYQRTVSPVFPAGVPEDFGGIESILVTGTDVGPIDVLEANLGTFGVSSWGVGGAVIAEVCGGSSEPCPKEDMMLVASNIGSSGQDGVEIDFGADAGSVSVTRRRCPDCPPGHVTLMKFYDEEARVMLSVPESDNPATGASEIAPDFSAIGAGEFLLELLDPAGDPISTSIQISGMAIAFYPNCPAGSYPKWVWIAGHWYFMGCISYMDFVLPTGEVINDVAEARLTPIHPTSDGTPRQCVVTDTSTITITDVTVTPRCTGDLNGSDTVDLTDLAILLSNFGTAGGASLSDGDLNGDGTVDLTDLAMLLARFGSACG